RGSPARGGGSAWPASGRAQADEGRVRSSSSRGLHAGFRWIRGGSAGVADALPESVGEHRRSPHTASDEEGDRAGGQAAVDVEQADFPERGPVHELVEDQADNRVRGEPPDELLGGRALPGLQCDSITKAQCMTFYNLTTASDQKLRALFGTAT